MGHSSWVGSLLSGTVARRRMSGGTLVAEVPEESKLDFVAITFRKKPQKKEAISNMINNNLRFFKEISPSYFSIFLEERYLVGFVKLYINNGSYL
jgi:hypothetical protein